ncbi:MAG TPA: hypothetical protein VI039_07155 [Solirubrobacterales bacterium]
MKKESLSDRERQALRREVRAYLPAFLQRGAAEQPDPAGDVRELLRLEQEDLEQVVAVHQCLAPAVLQFGAAVEAGLRRPASQQSLGVESSQAIRGPIDWVVTAKERARVPGEVARYAVRQPSSSTYDTTENRAVAWLLGRLAELVDRAVFWMARKPAAADPAELGWSEKIERLGEQVAAARQVPWISGLAPEYPTSWVLRSLRASRDGFYARDLPAAIDSVMRLSEPSAAALTAVLSERYFQPEDDGTLFQVAVALRLAKAFEALSPDLRRTRLLMGDGRSSFARFAFDDGSEVSLAYQAWPDGRETMRRSFVKRHGIGKSPKRSIPDLIVLRRGSTEDAVILELKASSNAEYLRGGLQELLAYLADRPDLWGAQPAGWLVAPASEAFEDAGADSSFPIWILDADGVARAATDRFVTS